MALVSVPGGDGFNGTVHVAARATRASVRGAASSRSTSGSLCGCEERVERAGFRGWAMDDQLVEAGAVAA
ncbi:hypothetical protein ACFUIY_05760 [Streptomyces griseorubiginosus]|uniref:hypothetical protein n=1 Tax=Streptomyces griseorubiginosus TaxID=67304 RepID=UPI001140207C|nr:hypothetical protein [Streptomyces griseorubiginosus]